MMDEDVEVRRTQLQRLNVNGGMQSHTPQPYGVGIGASNLSDILVGSQAKIDKIMSDLAEKMAAVEARATFDEKITITPEAIVIERRMTMAKDRKY
jgi:hypothetical protein